MSQASTADFSKQRQTALNQAKGLRFNLKIETLRKTNRPEHARGIIHEREGMEHADLLLL